MAGNKRISELPAAASVVDADLIEIVSGGVNQQATAAQIRSGIDHGGLSGLTDDDHSQYLLADGTRALTANWDAGSFEIQAQTFQSDVATGTAPLIVASTTVVTNLNADLLDGQHASAFAAAAHTHDHGTDLTGLSDDDHTQYALLAGRAGGQTLIGGTGANDDLVLRGSSNATTGDMNAVCRDFELDASGDISLFPDGDCAIQSTVGNITINSADTATFQAVSFITIGTSNSGTSITIGRNTATVSTTTAQGTWNFSASQTVTFLNGFGLRDTSAAFNVRFVCTSSTALDAERTFTLDLDNASRTLKLQGNLTVSAAATVSGTNTGDQVAGAGLTGTSTLNVGAGTGITVSASDVSVNQATAFAWTAAHTHTVAGLVKTLTNTENSPTVQVAIDQGDRSAPADNDEAYRSMQLSSVEGNQTEVARTTWRLTDADESTTVEGDIRWSVVKNGNLTDKLTLTGTALVPTELDLGSSSAPWAVGYVTTIELGHASDTTLARVSAGVASIEGAEITTLGNTTTGTGSIVRATSPTLVTPALGTPASGDLSNCTSAANHGYIFGLVPSNAADTDHDITIAVGQATDKGHALVLKLTSAITKQIDAAWSVGSAAGGMDTSSVAANTWYHIHLIRRSDTGVVDALFSTSLTAPTMPTNYDQRVYLASVLTDGSANILNGTWENYGNGMVEFLWNDPPLDADVTEDTTANSRTLSVPTGLSVWAKMNVVIVHASAIRSVYISALDQNDEAASGSAAPLIQIATGSGGTIDGTGDVMVKTNTSGQIRTVASGASTTLRIATLGWIQNRGGSVSQG